MKIIKSFTRAGKELDRIAARGLVANAAAERIVKEIIEDVRKRRDVAVRKYSRRFERVAPKSLIVSRNQMRLALKKLDPDYQRVFRDVIRNVQAFHKAHLRKSWQRSFGGPVLGERISPIDTVGVYIPGGRAPLVSTVFMSIVPALVAGVRRIVAVSPPSENGQIHYAILAALELLGIHEVYCVGGAQAIGALAWGTQTIPKVDKIVGPGNLYVTLAKKAVFGKVDIDMLAGPSEIMVLAGPKARADYIASDLLAQAEHDPMSASVLVTSSSRLAMNVRSRVTEMLGGMTTNRKVATQSLGRFGCIIVVDRLDKGVDLVNRFAPEHLELIGVSSKIVRAIRHAGAIFVGPYSPVALGDYYAGPSHVLPTNSSARFSSGLSVDTFLKKSSYISYGRKDSKALERTSSLAALEGLEAHVKSVNLRLGKIK